MSSFQRAALFLSATSCFTGCDMFNPPHSGGGKPSILISLHEQRAYLRQGKAVVSEAPISTGREGHTTPAGNFHVTRKDIAHRSSVYGDFVDTGGHIVKAGMDAPR